MAVGMLITGEGVTHDLYVQLTKKMFGNYPMRSDQAPEGLIVHTAGKTADGFYVYDIWESKKHFQRFADKQLGPAARELSGGKGGDLEPEFNEIEVLVHGR